LDRLYDFLITAQITGGGASGAGGGAAAGGGAGPPAGGGGGAQACGGGEQLLFMLGMLVIFYFLLIRPQQKRAKAHKSLISELKRGDNVITSSGIFGRIVNIDGNVMTLDIAKNTQIKVLRNYVSGLANPETEKELSETPTAK
jgi:preprotein translocase subunit YajC